MPKDQKDINNTKTTAFILAVIAFVILCLIPIPTRIKDGGSLYLQPLVPLYSVTCWNGMHDEYSRTAGITVELAGMEIYNSFHIE